MKIEFESCSENEAFARTVIAAYITRLNPTLEELSDVKTAVSEAVTNCIVHGYEGRKTEIVDNSIAAILKSPNKIAKTIYAAGTAVVAGVASVGVFTVKKVKKSKKNPEAKRK